MIKTEKQEEATAEMLEQRYNKQQLMTSSRYAHRRDLIGALLVDGRIYATGEVDVLIKNYDERKM